MLVDVFTVKANLIGEKMVVEPGVVCSLLRKIVLGLSVLPFLVLDYLRIRFSKLSVIII